jgi:hypothetical protein
MNPSHQTKAQPASAPDVPTKTADAVRFLVSRYGNGIGRTQLMKLLYLADLEAHRFLGRSITPISYRWYNHGPFSETLYHSLELLLGKGEMNEEKYTSSHGTPASKYTYNGVPSISTLDDVEQILLASVLDEYSKTPLTELLEEIVYKTKPMTIAQKKGDHNNPLDLSAVDKEGAWEYGGVDLYRLIQGETEARSGLVQPLDEVERELRAEYQPNGEGRTQHHRQDVPVRDRRVRAHTTARSG